MGLHRVRHDWSNLAIYFCLYRFSFLDISYAWILQYVGCHHWLLLLSLTLSSFLYIAASVNACVLSCVQLCNPMDWKAWQVPLSMGFFQAKILEWIAISSSRESSPPRDQTCIDRRILYHRTRREAQCVRSSSFLWSYIPLCFAFLVFICQLLDIWVISSFWLWWIIIGLWCKTYIFLSLG